MADGPTKRHKLMIYCVAIYLLPHLIAKSAHPGTSGLLNYIEPVGNFSIQGIARISHSNRMRNGRLDEGIKQLEGQLIESNIRVTSPKLDHRM